MCRECPSNAMLVPVPADSFFSHRPKPPRAPPTPTSAQTHRYTGTLHMRDTLGLQHAPRALTLLMAGAVALIIAACGGGYGGGSGSVAMGCGGAYGSPCAAPTVTMTSPGATVNRTVKLSATASAASGASVKQVDVMIDGTIVGTATAAPYTVSWDSTTVSDGSHALTGKVTDNQMATATSAAITLAVKNNPVFSVMMAAAQIFPAPGSSATGTANLSGQLASGATSGKATLR